MKIAFVGKGGAGKTTTSSLFAQYVAQTEPVLAIDADINMHMAELLGGVVDHAALLSEKEPSQVLRTYLRGSNSLIANNAAFKKSTPPGRGSRLVTPANSDDWFMRTYTQTLSNTLSLAVVGSYSETGIASSCYHNNLSILENLLSHTTDHGTIVVDMVAGTDAFASTLFAQFDALVFVAEPTQRSLAVYDQYYHLARHAGVEKRLLVVANKVDDEADAAYIAERINSPLAGAIERSPHLAAVDKGRTPLLIERMSPHDRQTLGAVYEQASRQKMSAQSRLPLLWDIHKTYVAQPFIVERFGDLTIQIDTTFTYPEA